MDSYDNDWIFLDNEKVYAKMRPVYIIGSIADITYVMFCMMS